MQRKSPDCVRNRGLSRPASVWVRRRMGAAARNKCLAVTYFRMGKPHTIIGDVPFHF